MAGPGKKAGTKTLTGKRRKRRIGKGWGLGELEKWKLEPMCVGR
jgi:hypothetical protein